MKDEDIKQEDPGKLLLLEGKLKEAQKQLAESKHASAIIGELTNMLTEALPRFKPHKPLTRKAIAKDKISETALLLLSDIHGDQIIMPNRVQGLESYNYNAVCHRAARIVDTTISHLHENMTQYNFTELVVLMAGDLVGGEIHKATQHSAWGNPFKNAIGVGELIANMLVDVLHHIHTVRVVSVPGNHGRRSKKKDYRGAHNNWDYLVMMVVKMRLWNYIEEGRLQIEIPESYTAVVNIEGYNFIVNHFDDIIGYQGIPWYGIERKTRRLAALGGVTGVTPDYFVGGHFHTYATQQHTQGEVIINGSWPATDEYALEKLGAFGEPFQLLAGVHKKHGLTWRMPIKLRGPNWKKDEVKKPRYSVRIFD